MLDLFILETCPYCQKVMTYLDSKNIKYNKIDTSNNDNALRLLSVGGIDQVPFLYNEATNDKIYDSNKIIEYIESNYKQV